MPEDNSQSSGVGQSSAGILIQGNIFQMCDPVVWREILRKNGELDE